MRRLPSEDRAGIYITIIVHLVVLIVLMAAKLGTFMKKEQSFVLDFTKAEQIERMQRELEFKQAVNDRLNELLSSGGGYVANVPVDRSTLKDDRTSEEDARKLYEDAQRLQEELQKGVSPQENEIVAAPEPVPVKEKPSTAPAYSGPSVLSYSLEGRKASHLPIPAYRCMGAGEVKVLIGVDPQGNVQTVKIDDSVSSSDGCLRSFATRAARLSKFSASATAPARQSGYIIYSFVAQ